MLIFPPVRCVQITTLRCNELNSSWPVDKTPAYAPSGWCGPREQFPNSINSLTTSLPTFGQRAADPNLSICMLDGRRAVIGGRADLITNKSGAKLSKSMRCIYYRDDGEEGGVGLLQEQETDSGSWYKQEWWSRNKWVAPAMLTIRWYVFYVPSTKTTTTSGRSRTEKIMLRKIEPKSFGIAMCKGGIYQKWFERG